MDDCIRGLDVNVRAIVFDDLLDLRSTTEPHDSVPSLLAQCYGNRSAALFEMGEHEVRKGTYGFYPVGGGAGGRFPPKLPSFPPQPSSFPHNVTCCEPYIALKFKIFWGEPPDPLP